MFLTAAAGKLLAGSDATIKEASISFLISISTDENSPGLYLGYPFEKSIEYAYPVCHVNT
ncbi:hypothetical protein ES703_87679 [subsurface metagenome]